VLLKSESSPNSEARNTDARYGGFRHWGFGFPSDFGLRASGFCCLRVLFCALLLDSFAAQPTTNAQQPFLRFRERTLDYAGPEGDEGEVRDIKEVNIGWFGPYDATNHLAADMWWSASFAIQEANAQGGLRGLPFRLIPRWAVDPWGTGVSQLTRMIYDEHPMAVLGSVDSPSTHLAEQVVAKAQLPLVSPMTTDKSVTLAGVSWMFACAPTDDAIARVLVEEILAALKSPTNKVAMLAATDHESRMTAREVVREFSRREHPLDFRFDVPPGALTHQRQLAVLEQMQPAAVIIVAGTDDAATLVSAVREKCPASALFGTQSMGRSRFVELAGQSAAGVRFPLLFVPNPADPVSARFIDRFKTEHRREPDYTAALTYDATRLLLEAIRRGGLNRARIRQAIPQLSPWTGIAGPIRWDGTGQNTRSNVSMGVIRNGAVVPIN
jgi:branched-chain amino acid transport system substrate-binding protein